MSDQETVQLDAAEGEPLESRLTSFAPVARVESLDWAHNHALPELVDTDRDEVKIVLQRGHGSTPASAVVLDVGATLDKYRTRPRRKQFHHHVETTESFVRFVETHKDEPHTTLWANPKTGTFEAVFDDNGPAEGGQRFGEQRCKLQLRATVAWQRWVGVNGKLMKQTEFGDLITAGMSEIRPKTSGDPAAMLDGAEWEELADSFHATMNVSTRSKVNRQSGKFTFAVETDEQAKAGRDGRLVIPQRIGLILAPFIESDPIRVDARFIYRVTDDGLQMGIRIDNLEQIMFDAVMAEAFKIETLTGLRPYIGH